MDGKLGKSSPKPSTGQLSPNLQAEDKELRSVQISESGTWDEGSAAVCISLCGTRPHTPTGLSELTHHLSLNPPQKDSDR